MDVSAVARLLLDEAVADEQVVRRIPDDRDADAVRAAVRTLARERGVRIRSARLGDAVAVVRLDAAVWHEDQATMRRKLTPSD